MIHFNPTTHTFNLGLNSSFYAFQVDAEGRLVHLGWGPRPAGADDALLGGQITGPDESTPFEQQPRRDELITFGDVTYHEVSLGASLNELDEAELAEYTSTNAFYKRIRHIVQNGNLYRLQRLEEFGASVVEVVLPAARLRS